MHKAKAVALICIDYRFQKTVQNWLEENNYLGLTDEIIVAGSTRDIVKPIEHFHFDALIRQLKISVQLHNPDEILLIDHQDCGGYAQDNTISGGLDEIEDMEKHKIYLEKTKEILEKEFPKLKYRKLYVTLNGEVKEL